MAAFARGHLNLLTSSDNVRASGGAVLPILRHDNNSPLQVFVKAKKKINAIFAEIDDYVHSAVSYMKVLKENDTRVVTDAEIEQLQLYAEKVKCIRDVLTRDHMKVAFFGRTSNGKSTVINAMLHDKILPSGIGHTTNCFLQVEGSDTPEAYLMVEGSKDKQNVKSIGQLAHALCQEKLVESELVRIFWPRDKCLLLRDDVVFVDSPGVDVTPNLDEWIDKHCLDADVFILVANAESTLMVTEKNFFHKVSTKLSKPNIFILNNRWDASATEIDYLDRMASEQEMVREQHYERAMGFLVNELKVCTAKEAESRIFFISAKEALHQRLNEQGRQTQTPLIEGYQNRYFEFVDFEQKFQECISKSAIKTKFEQHSQRGRQIATDIRAVLDGIYEQAQQLKEEKLNRKKEINERLAHTEQQLIQITQEMKEKIRKMVDDVEQRVSTALSEEIKRLSNLVDEFNLPFHTEPLVLNVYKKELHLHVENGLGSKLRGRLSTALALNIESNQHEMTKRMAELLPSAKQKMIGSVLPRREPFEVLYRLNCDNLCADFREDLDFKFSWGLMQMMQRFCGNQNSNKNRRAIVYNQQYYRAPSSMGGSELDSVVCQEMVQPTQMMPAINSDEWSYISRMALASVGSQGTVGGLVLAGFMLKTVGWRVIAVLGSLYAGVYFYERLTWTNKAKERSFKSQYVQHATKKLRMIVDLTSANCSHQVQQELSSTFARLCHLIDESTSDMSKDLQQIDVELRKLDDAVINSKVLRNKANYLSNELQVFDDIYLKTHC